MTTFTPLASLLGGGLIGLAALLLWLTTGRIAGVSGILSGLIPLRADKARLERLAFVAGLVAAPVLYALVTRTRPPLAIDATFPVLALAGLLVGYGAVLGSGCTSGHGVCGLARLSKRSLVATLVFMTVAITTVFFSRHVVV